MKFFKKAQTRPNHYNCFFLGNVYYNIYTVQKETILSLNLLPQVDDPIDMLPKSRKALSIQEIAALARSSFNGEDLNTCSFIHQKHLCMLVTH